MFGLFNKKIDFGTSFSNMERELKEFNKREFIDFILKYVEAYPIHSSFLDLNVPGQPDPKNVVLNGVSLTDKEISLAISSLFYKKIGVDTGLNMDQYSGDQMMLINNFSMKLVDLLVE